jgi:rod shape determining protein RodA
MADTDRLFLLSILALLVSGLIVVYSACQVEDGGLTSGLWKKQILFATVGLLAMAISAAVPPVLWERGSWLLYPLALGLLALVIVIGSSAGGATRWISLGGFRFQPSELAKLATILLLAKVLASRRRPAENLPALLLLALIVLVPAALVLRQPDLGTALVFLVIAPPMLYWSGVSFPYLLLAFSPVLSVLCAASLGSWIAFSVFLLALAYFSRALLLEKILFVALSIASGIATPVLWGRMETYQQARILAFLDPEKYSTGAGYQIIQSKVAIGSGGMNGVGFLEGT